MDTPEFKRKIEMYDEEEVKGRGPAPSSCFAGGATYSSITQPEYVHTLNGSVVVYLWRTI